MLLKSAQNVERLYLHIQIQYIYVPIAIYMSKLQYIALNCNIYVRSLQNICPSRCMGFRFILPLFIVLADPYPGKDESEAAPINNTVATEERKRNCESRDKGNGARFFNLTGFQQQKCSPPVNSVGTFQDVSEELSSRFNFPRSAAFAAFPASSHASQQIACSFNPVANYGGRISQRRSRRQRSFLIGP